MHGLWKMVHGEYSYGVVVMMIIIVVVVVVVNDACCGPLFVFLSRG